MRRNNTHSKWRTAAVLGVAGVVSLAGAGCSTYTLTPITSAAAHSDFPEGAEYRVAPPKAFLTHAWSTGALGFGKPDLELTRWNFPERPAVCEVPAGTRVKIQEYVRFDQQGAYDCGFDGWRFAIATVLDGERRGKRILIDTSSLMRGDRESGVLAGPD